MAGDVDYVVETLMEDKTSPRPTPQLVLGIIIVILGVLFALDNLKVVAAGDFLRFWPLAVMAIGLTKLLDSQCAEGRVFGGILFGIGSLLLLDRLHVFHFTVNLFWPLVLVAVGLFVAWKAVMRERDAPGADATLVATAILGGVERNCNSQDFRGGDVTAIMGGCQIDLRQAAIKTERAVIKAFAFWGGIEIRVPDKWAVEIDGFPFLGGITDSTHSPSERSNQRLLIRCFVMMGGIEIKN